MFREAVNRILSSVRGTEPVEEPVVWLDPFHQPSTAFEQRVYQVLADGPRPLRELVERIAREEMIWDYAAGFSAPDVGAGALPLLRDEVRRLVYSLDGGQLAVATPVSVRCQAFDSWQLQLCA